MRVEEVPVRFEVPGIDEYARFVADTAGPIAIVLRGLSEAEHDTVKVRARIALERFARPSGYQIPGVALCAVAT
ncbi:MAG: hypothetical protein R2736_19845 [Solirubrobacterales bacterium]